MRDFLFFFLINFLAYGILCWNMRAITNAWYADIVASDMVYSAMFFTVIKRISADKSKSALAGYVLGGAVGSVTSVWLTKTFLGR